MINKLVPNRFTFSCSPSSVYMHFSNLLRNNRIRRREQVPDKSFLKSSRRDLKTGATMYVGSGKMKMRMRKNKINQESSRDQILTFWRSSKIVERASESCGNYSCKCLSKRDKRRQDSGLEEVTTTKTTHEIHEETMATYK